MNDFTMKNMTQILVQTVVNDSTLISVTLKPTEYVY